MLLLMVGLLKSLLLRRGSGQRARISLLIPCYSLFQTSRSREAFIQIIAN